ncbi:MAG: stage 0 sporulation protein [Clostridia bacterium]|nr:stage 0 sporulation protein [Clostridia bacterium]
MPMIVGVKFERNAKTYSFDPGELVFEVGDKVIVDTQKGNELGEVVTANTIVPESECPGELKKVVRRATPRDLELAKKAKESEPRALRTAREKATALGIGLKFISAEVSFDCKRVVLYFTAEERVDFRELVKELASALHARIELRQLYERDDVKLRGSLGMCGRECCCRSYLRDFEKVTVKMAKVQGLSLNPTKISGICGKLMCCLKYENDYYAEVYKIMPKVNGKVTTPDGPAVVMSVDMLKKTVTCKVTSDETFVVKTYPVEELTFQKKAPQPQQPSEKKKKHRDGGKRREEAQSEEVIEDIEEIEDEETDDEE